ncbi:MAG: sodium/proton-translocating pyrophosphatase [Bacteroidales bacterium]|nr:sodium/proton-translocating pyrophosphatase [Bacteroidales bacterium]
MENLIYYLFGIAVLGIAYMSWKTITLLKKDEGSVRMKEVSSYINSASMSYVKTSYKVLAAFVVLLAVLLFLQDKYVLNSDGILVVSFIIGAILAAGSGYLSINLISKSHARTAKDAETSSDNAFRSIFSGGMANGIAYVSIAIAGITGLFIVYGLLAPEWELSQMLNIISAYILGVSVVALFDRIVGGVFAEGVRTAKTEVHKSEEAIPENSAVNPAEIANAAGVNINNGSGASADMSSSHLVVIISAMLLGVSFVNTDAIMSYFSFGPVLLPLAIAGVGILSSITASFFVKSINTTSFWTGYRFAHYFAISVAALASFFIVKYMLPAQWEYSETLNGLIVTTKYKYLGVFWTLFIGMIAGVLINFSTDYFTLNGKPVNKLIENTFKGFSSNILSGTSKGFLATAVPVLIILTSISGAYYFADFFGVAMTAIGFLMNAGIVLAINSSKPLAKNADTLAKMTLMNDETIQNTEELASFAEKKEVYVKGLSIAAAAFAGISLLSIFLQKGGVSNIELDSPWTISFMMLGALIPFLFSSVVIDAVNSVAEKTVDEVKRQFEEIPELKAALDIYRKYFGDPDVPTQGEQDIVNAAEGKAQYDDLVIKSTYSSIRALIIPIVLAIAIPVFTGYLGGVQALTGLLTGIIPMSFILAFTQANSAALWNSTKNEIAAGVIYKGEKYDKYSDVYQTAVQGAKVGDVYRNASAPALNILIKISVIIALMIAFAI